MEPPETVERVPVYTPEQIEAMEKHFREQWLGQEPTD
jgi:hypothetical protein